MQPGCVKGPTSKVSNLSGKPDSPFIKTLKTSGGTLPPRTYTVVFYGLQDIQYISNDVKGPGRTREKKKKRDRNRRGYG